VRVPSVSLQRGGVIIGVVRDANTAQPIVGVGINPNSNDQFYTQSGQSTPKAVTLMVGSVVSAINSTLNCGKAPPKYIAYVPLLVR
jgi:hypothetical protein